jgi:hypothetical protein
MYGYFFPLLFYYLVRLNWLVKRGSFWKFPFPAAEWYFESSVIMQIKKVSLTFIFGQNNPKLREARNTQYS